MVIFTGLLVLMALLQLLVFGYQAIQLRNTVRAAAGQSEAMERSIREANRLASAMEAVAQHFELSVNTSVHSTNSFLQRGEMQMRAYLTVIVGAGAYQDRAKNIRFAGNPAIVNTGPTPAYRVRHKTAAGILAIPLPADFDFPLPDQFGGGNTIGPHQNAALSVILDDFVDDSQIDDIKLGKDPGLYIWGIIVYEDAFGHERYTKFCQILTWLPNGNVWGYFLDRHNEAT